MKIVTLARKPVEGSVASCAVAHGAGALNIDGSRISGPAWTRSTETLEDMRGGRYGTASKDRIVTGPREMPSGGRWPANLILQHKPGCRQTGSTAAPGYTINRWSDGAKPFGGGAGHDYESEQRPDEQVAVWSCVEEACAVYVFGKQSGEQTSGIAVQRHGGGQTIGGIRGIYRGSKGLTREDAGYGDTGTAARYFQQVQEKNMHELPQELVDYLETMITPPNGEVLVALDLDEVAWEVYEDNQLHGLIGQGDPTPHMEDIWRVLRPGAFVAMIAPDSEPTGHSGACALEDKGFEIRDSILLVQEPGRIHYVAKCSTAERNAGIVPFERKVKEKRLFPKEEHLDEIEEAFAEERTEAELAAWAEGGASRADIPKEYRDWFEEREVEITKIKQNDHPCLHPDADVMTERGYRPISSIEAGERVYTADGQFHAVAEVSRHPYTSTHLYEIEVAGTNLTTRATDNHPFLIWRPRREGKAVVGGTVQWLRADEITKGDYTMTPMFCEVSGGEATLPPRCSDPEFWFVFGLYLAEGVIHTSGGGTKAVYPSYTLCRDETALIARIESYFAPHNTGVYPKAEGNAVQVVPFDSDAGDLFWRLGGRGAATKSIDPVVWSLSNDNRAALVLGYLAGDGGRVRNYWQAKTVSRDLATQMRLLGESLSYKANLFCEPAKPGKIGSREFKTYQLRLYEGHHNTYVEHEGRTYVVRYVQRVTPVAYEGDVVNLSVDGDPTFQTAVGMSHNTVKAKEVMRRLISDLPEGSLVVDPFMGSGSTGIACVESGMSFTGIELEMPSLQIADARIKHWDNAELRSHETEISSEAKQPKRKKRSFLSLRKE